MSLNLGTILSASAEKAPDNIALRIEDVSISYGQLHRAAAGIAAGLRERGIQPGDKVALLVPNVPEFTMAYFGILYAGATVVPINVLAAAPEVAYFLEDSGSRLLIVHPLFEKPGRAGAGEREGPVITTGGEDQRRCRRLFAQGQVEGGRGVSGEDVGVQVRHFDAGSGALDFDTESIPEHSSVWSKCLVGQVHRDGQCFNQPSRLAYCSDSDCTTSPAREACLERGPQWRIPNFDEYKRLRDHWSTYSTEFDFPRVRTAILTSTAHPRFEDWLVAYQMDPRSPDDDPSLALRKTDAAWVHCVSSSWQR